MKPHADTPDAGMCDLDSLLEQAARADNWRAIVHRCAWCKHVFDEHGAYGNVVAFNPDAVATDGMCPSCAATALTKIQARKQAPRAA
jgi:hypothetical protein